jgi:glycosyltransferase involved in cell wall biosynthesis
LKEYAARDSRIIVLRNEERLNAGIARNRGLDAAAGEYVVFLDADDCLTPGALASFYETAVSYDADFVKGKAKCFTEDVREAFVAQDYEMIFIDRKFFDTPFNINSSPDSPKACCLIPVAPWGAVYRRTFLENNNIRFNSLVCVNDRSFSRQVIIYAARIVLRDEYYIFHRTGNPNSLVGSRAEHFDCQFASYELVAALAENLPENIRTEIMCSEMGDLMNWCGKFIEFPGIKEKTIAFINDRHDFEINKNIFKIPWYIMYYKLKYADQEQMLLESPIDDIHDRMVEYRGLFYQRQSALDLCQGKLKERNEILKEKDEELDSAYREIDKFMENSRSLEARYEELQQSSCYRIGRMVTFLPRRIKRIFSPRTALQER